MRKFLFIISFLVLSVSVMAQEASYRMSNKIMIIGHGEELRAFSIYGGSPENCSAYAATVSKYKKIFGDAVNVYCMTIPTQGEFYCPEEAKPARSELSAITSIYSKLQNGAVSVDAYHALQPHLAEPIYARTDHHWQPLGAYYAAQEFARVAGVPFKDLSHYTEHIVFGFVGTMAGYSKDREVANSPENFVYYVPKDVFYEAEYYDYTLDKGRKRAVSEASMKERNFFRTFPDGSVAAYSTFMGGDAKLVKVTTSTTNGRRLLILKDSFGNALPGYLFYSFENIHVVDCRYFTRNIINYVRENGITDILFANNITHASMTATWQMYEKYLIQ